MRTRVKICGITSRTDALAAIRHGADALGLVFYPPSPRNLEIPQALEIARGLPPFVTLVGLFVNADPETIREVRERVPLSLLQFHGDECADYCADQGLPWIKAVRMREGTDVVALAQRYSGASALLLDAYRPGVPGGTGDTFDWEMIPERCPLPLILAGGLTPANVGTAVALVRPYAVDVSGGVERSKGVKDADKISAFIQGVRLATEN